METRLDLRSNDIGVKGGVSLFQVLQHQNRTITSVDLSGMSGVNRYKNILWVSANLLPRNHIGSKGANAIAAALRDNQVLYQVSTVTALISKIQLTLQENGLGPTGIEIISKGLANNATLEIFDVSANGLGQGAFLLVFLIPKIPRS